MIEKVFGTYNNNSGVDVRTREALVQSIGSGSCLICISGVKKKDPIWSCESCHCVFHLQCIQRWAKDSIFQQKRDLENDNVDLSRRPNFNNLNSKVSLQWGCPKCRYTYQDADIPTR